MAGLAAALVLGQATLAAKGQTAPVEPRATKPATSQEKELDWWKNAVIYEIYPRSFQDTNGDGIGDLKGITKRLDYLKELGVDAIWLTPIYPSPQVDFGYDISDYRAIDPQYGTMADFDRLVAEAGKRHIRVIMDMVMNHTSDQHKWFLESRSSRTNPYRDWYIWRNPKVHEAFKDILAFWLQRGVGGFRFDAITELYEDPEMRDEGAVKDANGNPIINAFGDPELDNSRTSNQPGLHEAVAEMRAEADKFDFRSFPGTRVMIGETYMPNIAELAKMYGTQQKPEFHLPMDTQVGMINKLDVATFRSKLTDIETRIDGNVPMLLFDNHDNPRIDMRYGDGIHNTQIERVIATVLFASRGAALMYYGDEIGMVTTPPTRKEDVKDPIGVTGWPKEKGRDGERTPMQWNTELNAGFTTGDPWLPVPPSAAEKNVEVERADPDSLFNWYRTLIHLKKTVPALEQGANIMLDTENTSVLSWLRQAPGAAQVVVSVNFTAQPQIVNLQSGGAGLAAATLHTLLKSPGGVDPKSLDQIVLAPFGIYIGEEQ